MLVENLRTVVVLSILVMVATGGVVAAGPGGEDADDTGFAATGSVPSAMSDESIEAEPNDNRSQATPVPESGSLRGEVNNTGGKNDTDWFSFDANAGDGVHFFTGDVIESVSGTVYAPNGSAVFSFETGGMDSYIKGTVLQRTGTYYVAFRSDVEDYSTGYSVGFETTSPDPFEPNENRENAVSIPTNGTITWVNDDSVSVEQGTTNATVFENDEDWFAVDAAAGENITAVAHPQNLADYGQYVSIDIFDSQGNPIGVIDPSDDLEDLSNRTYDAGSARGSPREATQAATADTAGTYYIRVRSPDDTLGGYVKYRLTVDSTGEQNTSTTETAEPTETADLSNTLTIQSTGAQRVTYTVSASGRLAPGTSADLPGSGASSPDLVNETTASGSTAKRGKDDFTFAGDITNLSLHGGPAKVLINGEQVDPDSFGKETQTTTATATQTATATPTPTATATVTASSTSATTTSSARTNTRTEQVSPTQESSSSSETDTLSPTPGSPARTTRSGPDGAIVGGTADGTTSTESGGSGPGFGVLPAVGALVVLGTLVAFRRR